MATKYVLPNMLAVYQSHLHQIQSQLAQLHSRQWLTAAALAITAALVLALAITTLRRLTPLWSVPTPLPIAALCARRYGRQNRRRSTLARLRAFYESGVARLTNQWQSAPDTGEEYAEPGHLYAHDLNLFGPSSLFQRLSIARTEPGKRKLAHYLQSSCPLPETLARQQAIQELTANTALREQIATLGHDYQQAHAATFSDWLAHPVQPFPNYLRLLILLTSLAAATIGLISLPAFYTALALQLALAWALRPRVAVIIQNARLLSVELTLIQQAIKLLSQQNFESQKLTEIVQTLQPAPAHLRAQSRYLRILTERNKEHFYLPASVVLLGTQSAMAIENWRANNGPAMARWLDAWSEFEALQSLACYAYENPANSYPVFEATNPTYAAKKLSHPLLEKPVPNDINLPNLLLISGSNMAGKSTLLRAIGLNAVLAKTGAPVRAASLHLSPFTLVASISIQDALAEGKSRFLAEVERLKAAITLSKTHPPLLFLIDEIFSGTNSADRRQAAQAVLETLTANNAIGVVSTHDLALTNLSPHNAHMCARTDADPLAFDYILKPGINTQSSALAIARLAGVPV